MNFHMQRRAGLLVAMAAVAVPTAASADGLDTAVEAVQQHTEKADAALERAVSAFERGANRQGTARLDRSRKEMGLAIAAAAKLLRDAATVDERVAAARALAIVASQRDQNVEELVGVLPEADGRAELRVAHIAQGDTSGREKAIGVLAGLAPTLPVEAAHGIAIAIVALSTDRAGEVLVEVTADHGSVADILSRLSDRMPASIREFVAATIRLARENAQGMRENRPQPPAGSTAGSTAGPPEGTPGGKPAWAPGP